MLTWHLVLKFFWVDYVQVVTRKWCADKRYGAAYCLSNVQYVSTEIDDGVFLT